MFSYMYVRELPCSLVCDCKIDRYTSRQLRLTRASHTWMWCRKQKSQMQSIHAHARQHLSVYCNVECTAMIITRLRCVHRAPTAVSMHLNISFNWIFFICISLGGAAPQIQRKHVRRKRACPIDGKEGDRVEIEIVWGNYTHLPSSQSTNKWRKYHFFGNSFRRQRGRHRQLFQNRMHRRRNVAEAGRQKVVKRRKGPMWRKMTHWVVVGHRKMHRRKMPRKRKPIEYQCQKQMGRECIRFTFRPDSVAVNKMNTICGQCLDL